MAGDKKGEQRKQIDRYSGPIQSDIDDLRTDTLVPQNQQFWNNYMNSVQQAQGDYGNLQKGYQNFADTGGFSDQDLGNIRSRAVSPLRSVYSNANREVDRARSLQGGYSPGYGTLKSRMSRELGQGLSDASTNAEGMIAQMVQQGKLAGLSGGANLYGTTPGMANMFGNQVLQSTNQRLEGLGQQGNLAMGLIGAQQNAQALPGKWEGTIGRIGDVVDIGTQIASPFMGGYSQGGGITGNLPSSRAPGSNQIFKPPSANPISRTYGSGIV